MARQDAIGHPLVWQFPLHGTSNRYELPLPVQSHGGGQDGLLVFACAAFLSAQSALGTEAQP